MITNHSSLLYMESSLTDFHMLCVLPGGSHISEIERQIAPQKATVTVRGWHWHHISLKVSGEKPMNTGSLSHLFTGQLCEIKPIKNFSLTVRFVWFFPPQPQPYYVIFSTFSDSDHLLTRSYKIWQWSAKWSQNICQKVSPCQNICQLPRCSIAITDIPQDAFQLSEVHGRHAITIVGLLKHDLGVTVMLESDLTKKAGFCYENLSKIRAILPLKKGCWKNCACSEWMQNKKIAMFFVGPNSHHQLSFSSWCSSKDYSKHKLNMIHPAFHGCNWNKICSIYINI